MLLNIFLQDILRHTGRMLPPEQIYFAEIVTISAGQITSCPHRLDKYLKFSVF